MSVFSQDELDTILAFIDHTKGMSIEGKEIMCFKDLYSWAIEGIQIIPKTTLTDYIEQVNLMKDSYETFGCENCSLFDKIIHFLESKK